LEISVQGQAGDNNDSADFPQDLNETNAEDLNPEPEQEAKSDPNPENSTSHPLLGNGTTLDRDPTGPELLQNDNDLGAKEEDGIQSNHQEHFQPDSDKKGQKKTKQKPKRESKSSWWCCC
jgi:hypothetical protein